jgi:hypothetical protein
MLLTDVLKCGLGRTELTQRAKRMPPKTLYKGELNELRILNRVNSVNPVILSNLSWVLRVLKFYMGQTGELS